VLAVIGAATVLVVVVIAVLALLLDATNDYTVKQRLVSPDGRFVAVRYTGMGGGAAGWCAHMVDVLPAAAPFSKKPSRVEYDEVVYSGRCSVTPGLRWLSPTELLITVPERDGDAPTRATVYGSAASGQVRVRLEFESAQTSER